MPLLDAVDRASPGTATIVVGDPPPDRGAHGVLERPDALFDDSLRSTLVVATPGLARPGRPTQRLVSTLDVVPTVLDLLALPAEPSLDARSLLPLVTDPAAAGRSEMLSSVPRKAGRVARSVRSSRFRYTEWPDGSRELYDLASDRDGDANLARDPRRQDAVGEMKKVLDAGFRAALVRAPADGGR